MIKILLDEREVLGQDRISFYKDLIVIEGLIQLSDGSNINPFERSKYYMKIKFEHGFKVLVTKQQVMCVKTEKVAGMDGWIFKYFFKKV
jgi:hypothetical protein